MANRCVLRMRIVRLDRSDNDFARVHANSNLEIDPFLGPQLLRVTLHLLLHPQRRVQGSQRVILMGDRRTEQRKDPARASSGSRSSIKSIEPSMSAKSAVTVLRSPSSGSPAGCSGVTRIWGAVDVA